jgi:hypothetical protein
VKAASAEYATLKTAGCLINPDLGGFAFVRNHLIDPSNREFDLSRLG